MSDGMNHHEAYYLCQLPPGYGKRVLVLDPGEFADPITCTLQLHSVDEYGSDVKPYEAISYVWGDPTITRSIHVNGHIMHITTNIFLALQQLRSKDTPRRLWTDAICINQSNFQEKCQQVNCMGAIYSEAARVIVWMGPDEEAIAESATSAIKKFNRLIEKQLTPQQFSSGWGPLHDPDGTITTEEMKHVPKLFQLPWFTRVWVIQEVGLAKDVLLAWGSATVEFVEIIQFIRAWNNYHSRKNHNVYIPTNYIGSLFSYVWVSYIPKDVKAFDKVWFRNSPFLRYEAQLMRDARTIEFEDIIFRCRYILRATDTRDYVYASLAHPTATAADGKPIVNADYTISEAELRLRLFSIISRRSLRFLGLVWHTREEELASGPSWCPGLDSLKYSNMTERYDASKNLSTFQDILTPTVENKNLKVGALIVDEVHLCGEVAGHVEKGSDLSIHDALRPVVHEVIERYWLLANQSNLQYPSAYADRLMAFASTLIAAIETEQKRVIAKHFGEFCRDHCPSINKLLQQHWVNKWGLSQPGDAFFPYGDRSAFTIQSQRFFTTIRGYYGMASPLVQPGDLICIIPTAQTPFIIRRLQGEESKYYLVCSCYVYGLMYGDAVEKWREDPALTKKVDVVLV